MMQCIMVVDHNESNLLSLEKLLVASGFEVITASEQGELTENLRRDDIHLILVNTSTAFVDASWFCSHVRERKEHHHMPVFFISNVQDDMDEAAICFEAGGSDYLKKPINTNELLSRISFHIEQSSTLSAMHIRNERLAALATYDPLTKVSSRLHMQTLLRQQQLLLKRHGGDIGFIYLRIMRLNRLNTLFGYREGDKILILFAATLKKLIRKSDIIARWSGGDFMVMLPNTDGRSSLTFVKKINRLLSSDKALMEFSLKYSFGVVQMSAEEMVAALIDRSRTTMEEAAANEYENIIVGKGPTRNKDLVV